MRHQIIFASMLATAMGLIFSGCNPLADLPGHYEGTLYEQANGKGRQQPVRADISKGKGGRATVAIKDIRNAPLLNLDLSDINDDKFKIMIPKVTKDPAELREDSGCYALKGENAIRFCFDKGELMLEVTIKGSGVVFTLAIDRFTKIAAKELEKPKDFTLTGAVDHALKRNFDNRTEFENVKQARATRNLSRLNLLPGITLPSLVALIVRDPASIISSIGDLAPFLLPTRWLQMLEGGPRYEAEQDAMILMRADTALQVEGFAYVLARDRSILDFYRETMAKANEAKDEIEAREDLGQFPRGTSDDIRSVVNGIQQAVAALDLALKEDRTAISQTLGFNNPDGVRDLTLDVEIAPVTDPMKYSRSDVRDAAIYRSYEIRQLDSLIKVARYQKAERFFNWLDPAGDYTGKLGFGIGEFIKIGASQVTQLWIKREAVQSAVTTKVFNALSEYENALDTYNIAIAGFDIQERRLARILEHVRFGTNLDMFGLVQVFQDYLGAEVAKENAVAAYRVARAKIDRFLLQGLYKGLAQKPDPINQ